VVDEINATDMDEVIVENQAEGTAEMAGKA
jgi:hypothetical protein